MKPVGTQEHSTKAEVACIDCGGGPVRPVFVRQPKEANFARRAGGDERPGDDKYVLVACRACGSMFLHPYYAAEAARVYQDPRYFRGYYPNNIHTGGGPPADKTSQSGLERWRMRARVRRYLRLAGLRGADPPPRVVDIGCAQGFLVEAFQDAGCDAYGVEISEQAARGQNRGLQVHRCRFEEAPFPPAFFDLIVATQVFEHIAVLAPVCEAMRRALKPRGAVILEVPNDLESYRSLVWRQSPWWLIPPMHVRYHTARSARRIFGRYGLRLEQVRTVGLLGWDAVNLLTWCLRRTSLRAVTGTGVYQRLLSRVITAGLLPFDFLLALGRRHVDLLLVLRQAAG